MSKAGFSLSELGKECVMQSWLETNLPKEHSKKEDQKGKEEDKITINSVNVATGMLKVSGKTTLMDGSMIFYSIRNEDNLSILDLEGGMVVSEGEFDKEVDISEMGEGELSVLVGFHPFAQPKKIREIYGDWGENLEGDDVVFIEADVKGADGYNRIWVEKTVEV